MSVGHKDLMFLQTLTFNDGFLCPDSNIKNDRFKRSYSYGDLSRCIMNNKENTRVETLIVATIYLQLIQNRYMFRSFTVLHCSHQHCVQPVASDVEVVGYL